MKIKIGINGMGRIGRMIVRAIYENNYKNIEIKHINNRTNSETCSNLLKYDSIHGKFNADISLWNVSKVDNIFQMFNGAKSFNYDLNSWNLSSLQRHPARDRVSVAL